MRRPFICCCYLALCCSLSFLQSVTAASASDALPPGYCEFFSEAERLPIDADKLTALSVKYATASKAPVARAKTAPWRLVYVPASTRTWKFEYQPASKPVAKSIRVFAFRHHGRVEFWTAPVKTVPVRSQKKHTAPVLFWGSESVADISLVLHLISMEARSIVHTCLTPIDKIPSRMAQMFDDCFKPIY